MKTKLKRKIEINRKWIIKRERKEDNGRRKKRMWGVNKAKKKGEMKKKWN